MKKKLCLALSGALCLSAGVGCGTETAEETLTPVRLNEVVHSVFMHRSMSHRNWAFSRRRA